MQKNYIIVVAGGKGLRMGSDIPKQFIPLCGRPVLMHTLEAFAKCDEHLHIILVLPKSQQAYWAQLCQDYGFDIPYLLADGGETRFHSVLNGLQLIPDDTDGVVGVHDGVRPFVSTTVIKECYAGARTYGAVVPVIPIVETVRKLCSIDGKQKSKTVNRDEYRLVQTPQTFSISLLKKAYKQPYHSGFTDDASVVEALGHPVVLTTGNRENIKITTPFDLQIAATLLQHE
ncbi:MAG: 2-C-methyl-D-erythritol 4-phosphate cytidylyltransferase [Paraprevotella sp.]|nr:2-C-methyl-D-erythritol 4-phosphate cytidylyltransferase [Paraprevotella sp.]